MTRSPLALPGALLAIAWVAAVSAIPAVAARSAGAAGPRVAGGRMVAAQTPPPAGESAKAAADSMAPAAAGAAADTKALVEGQLPEAPERALVQAKCLLCHTGEYVTMQRLTEKQWQGTVDKMRKFGSPANDEEAKAMVGYLARYWKPDLPPQRPVLAPPPPGSVPRK